MVFCWHADDGPKLNAGLVAVIFWGIRTGIARKPYIFVIFQGGGGGGGGSGPPVPPSGSTHAEPKTEICFSPLSSDWLFRRIIPNCKKSGIYSTFTFTIVTKMANEIGLK